MPKRQACGDADGARKKRRASGSDGDDRQAPEPSETATPSDNGDARAPGPRVAVLVPFRDLHAQQQRAEHLQRFVPFMTQFLRRHCAQERASFHILVIEQTNDGRKFNRGKLLNAGFDMARDDYDVFVFHDVDLLPGDELGELYATEPTDGPMHIARVWDRYNGNPHYFGGVVAFTRTQFLKVNGFPNTFWGWGGEDNELYTRVLRSQLHVQAPSSGTIEDLEDMDLETKLSALRASDWKCYIKRQLLKEHHRTWRRNGLKSLNYEFVDAVALGDACTKFRVDLGLNGHWSDDHATLNPPEQQHDEPRHASQAPPASTSLDSVISIQ